MHFEPERQNLVINFLHYLKENNLLYRNIHIDPNNLPENITNILTEDITKSIEIKDDIQEDTETDETDPLDKYKLDPSETALVFNIPSIFDEENLIVARGQGKTPISMLYSARS